MLIIGISVGIIVVFCECCTKVPGNIVDSKSSGAAAATSTQSAEPAKAEFAAQDEVEPSKTYAYGGYPDNYEITEEDLEESREAPPPEQQYYGGRDQSQTQRGYRDYPNYPSQ